MEQIGIAIFGVGAIWLSQDSRQSWRRWACILGMMGQPFWFWSAWAASQWGVFFVVCLYTYAWGRGIWTNWIQPRRTSRVLPD